MGREVANIQLFGTVWHRLVLFGTVWYCSNRLATGRTVRGSNPGVGTRFTAPVQTGPGAQPSLLYQWVPGLFPGVEGGRGVTLIPHHLLVPLSRKSRAITLLPLWGVRHVQSLSACTVELYLYSPYVPYGMYRASVPVQGCTLLSQHHALHTQSIIIHSKTY